MKKIVAIAIFMVVGFTSVQAQKTARMEFKSETLDYGDIKEGSDGINVFEVKNVGDAPLIIEDVKSSCGCTIPTKPSEPIQPGETGRIEVKYDTTRVGPIRKTVTVYSNSNEPVKALKIKGTVIGKDTDS